MYGEEMKKKKEYIIAGSLLSLAIVGMVFAYNTESGDKKAQEKEEQQVAFQEVEKDKETAKDEVEDVSSILKAKEKKEEQKQEQKQNIQNGLNFAKKALVTGQCDMLVLDEVLGLVKEDMATEDQIIEILQAKSLYTDVVLTGRDVLPRVFEMADSILKIVPEKV